MEFSVPQPERCLELTMADGAIVRARRHGNLDRPRLVLSHGNGFAIDGYYPFWRLLLADFEVVVYDQRNHGQNPRHDASAHSIESFVLDMERVRLEIRAAFGTKPTAALVHSVSAITALFHAARYGLQWDPLILFDPPIVPGDGHPLQALARGFELYLADWSRARPRQFKDPAELAEHFRRARGLHRLIPGAAELMARAVTRPAADGGFELACPPDFESVIYTQNAYSTVWQTLPALSGNLFVISSDPDAEDAKSPAKVCALLPARFGFRQAAVADTSHLMQIERPEECARAAREFLRAARFGEGR